MLPWSYRATMIAAMLVGSCGDPETLQRHEKEYACLGASISQYERDKEGLIEKRKHLRSEKKSTVDVAISQRRVVEDFCKRQAECFALTGESISNFFDQCLEDEKD